MNFRDLKVKDIKDLSVYYNIFADISLFENSNLRVDYYTSFPDASVEHCNRISINNYLDLIQQLVNNYEYIPLEISAQIAILDIMLKSLEPEYQRLDEEVKANEYTGNGNGIGDWENERDYSRARQKFDLIADIRIKIISLNRLLEDKLDNLMIPKKR